jgi:dTDP-4-dehydrorhamnose reductase
MKVLVTGAKGQLGMAIRLLTDDNQAEHEFLFTDVDELDITNHEEAEKLILSFHPHVIVNCASYNAVDQAEDEPELAISINGTAVQGLAGLARKHGSGFIHISSDFIFDGKKDLPYTELDGPNPQSRYAHSKFIGEQAVKTVNPNAAIIRTSWLYSEFGHNFVKTIRKIAGSRGEIRVVNDQFGTPTYATDLAEVILTLLPLVNSFKGVRTYNYSNEGIANWAEFAQAIIEFSGIDCKVESDQAGIQCAE